MKHFATPEFWASYRQLPPEIQQLADKNFEILKQNPQHPSLRFKKTGVFWSARVGLHYRALRRNGQKGPCGFGLDTTASTIKQSNARSLFRLPYYALGDTASLPGSARLA